MTDRGHKHQFQTPITRKSALARTFIRASTSSEIIHMFCSEKTCNLILTSYSHTQYISLRVWSCHSEKTEGGEQRVDTLFQSSLWFVPHRNETVELFTILSNLAICQTSLRSICDCFLSLFLSPLVSPSAGMLRSCFLSILMTFDMSYSKLGRTCFLVMILTGKVAHSSHRARSHAPSNKFHPHV